MAREFEDYLRGSSDYPSSPQERLFVGVRFKLDSLNEMVNLRVLKKGSNELDVEATNEKRLDLVKKNRIIPVKVEMGIPYYRNISRTSEGLMKIEYRPTLSVNLEALFPDEIIATKVAAEYLEVSESDILEMIKQGELKLKGKSLLLDYVNRVKKKGRA